MWSEVFCAVRRSERADQLCAAFGDVAVVGIGLALVVRASAVGLDGELTFALGAKRHVVLQGCGFAHYGGAGGGAGDLAAVIGFIAQADDATALMLHGWSRTLWLKRKIFNVTDSRWFCCVQLAG